MSTLLIAAAVVASAPAAQPVPPNQRQLDAISDRCGTSRKWLRNKHGEVHFLPKPTALYGEVVCVLGELKRDHAGPMGFVGSERDDER